MTVVKAMSVVALVGLVTGCASASSVVSEAERRAIEGEVSERLTSLVDAWTSLDATAVVAHYAVECIDTYNGERTDMKGLREWAEIAYQDLSGTEIGPFRDLRFDVLSREAVVVSWRNDFTETDAFGERQPNRVALMTQVWIRRDGEWLILHNHESTRPALSAASEDLESSRAQGST